MTARLSIDVETAVQGLSDLERASSAVDDLGESTSRFDSIGTGTFERIGHKVTDFATGLISGGIQAGMEAIGNSIELASTKAEAASKVNVLYGDSADEIIAASEGAATAVGLSSGAYLTAAGDIGNLITNMGITGENAADMSQSMITLAADMGSFNNASTEEVTAAMGAAFRGETEPIRQFGVMLDEAGIKAEAVKLGLYNGVGALDASARAQATYSLILDQTTAAQGDFARTSDGLANTQRINAAKQEEAWTKLGEAIMPLAIVIVPLIAEAITIVAGIILEVVSAIKRWIDENQPLINTVMGIVQAIAGFLMPILGGLIGVVGQVLGILGRMAGIILDIVGPAIGRLIEIVGRVAGVFGDIFGRVQGTLQGFQGHVSNAVDLVTGFFRNLQSFLSGFFGTVSRGLQTFGDAFSRIFDGIANAVGGAIDDVVGVFQSLWGSIQSIGGSIMRFLGGIFRPLGDAFNSAVDVVKRGWNTFAGFWNGIHLDIPRIEIPNPLGGSVVLGGGSIGLPHLPTFAAGGIATRPTAGIFGEAGPEALVPLSRARGLGGVTINVYAGVGDPVEIGREVVDAIHAFERANGPAL